MTISGEPPAGAEPGRYRVLLVEDGIFHERLIEAPDAVAAALRAEEPDDTNVTHLLVMPERSSPRYPQWRRATRDSA
ncbi:hypothetical protein [Amycolatopsis pigmentata]|uniref:Uncharacterized protein n=1 Tax=Amycolatopsis pigmentata TaxID=450801 RepID=A0ABW5G1V4_9PSEU